MRRAAVWICTRLPGNLVVFVAAIYLSNGVNVFTTIYSQPGRPVESPGLWLSCFSSLMAAGLWTALAVKRDVIEKAALSGTTDPVEREALRAQMWGDVWIRVVAYLGLALALSFLAMVALVIQF